MQELAFKNLTSYENDNEISFGLYSDLSLTAAPHSSATNSSATTNSLIIFPAVILYLSTIPKVYEILHYYSRILQPQLSLINICESGCIIITFV